MVASKVGPRATMICTSLGLDIPENSYSMLTSAISGSNYLVSPLQMVKAYSAFANQGKVSGPSSSPRFSTATASILPNVPRAKW